MTEKTKVFTRACPICGKSKQLEVSLNGFLKWVTGSKIQEALPELDNDDSERLMSGLHGECWDRWTESL